MIRLTVLFTLLLAATGLKAATISGTVRDGKDTSAMIGVIISIANSPRSAQTDIDGHYEFHDMPDGTYTLEFNYVSYAKESTTITVVGGADVSQDVVMKATGNQLTGTTVRTNRRTNTESSVILEIKKSNVVVSGISAAQISKTMDRNAADVVKRIPGVTIQDDRFITVRGLADRYNTVWLNDAGAPSAEADKKAFSFDIIPSGLIDRILIYKTPSPELPGDFAGGMVKVYTTSIPEKNTYTFGVSSSYRSGSAGESFNYNKKSSTDWLGYDKGVRSLPSIVTDEYVKTSQSNNNELSRAFGNDFQVFSKKQPLDLRVNGSASNVFKLGNVKLGSTIGFTYSNTSTNYNIRRQDFDDTDKVFNYNDQQSSNKANIGGLANIAAVIGNSKIEFKNLYNQIGNATVVSRTSNPDSFNARGANEQSYAMGYESRATYSAQLTGNHHNDADSRKYTWAIGYTDLYRNQPNLRRIKYVEQEPAGTGPYRAAMNAASMDVINGGGRYYASLFENIYSFSHQLTQKVSLIKNFEFDVNLGNYVEYKTRSFAARQFAYVLPNPSSQQTYNLPFLPVNEIFADSNVGGEGHFRIGEDTHDYDSYSATNRLIASFVSVTLPIGPRVKVVTGVRYEDNLYTLNAKVNQVPNEPVVKTKFLLPSINASYNFNAKSLVRAAYGKTINRPEFRETAPLYFYDFDRSAGVYGALFPTSISGNGDTLKVAQIQNVDVRYEFYPSSGEVIQIGGFYKHFKDPIQMVSYKSGDRGYTFMNGTTAYAYGVEVDVRKNLSFLGEQSIFRNLTVVGNLAFSRSELTLDTIGKFAQRLLPRAPLEGQSPYVLNTGIFYQSDSLGFQGSLLYNVYGPRAYSLGTIDDGSIGELAFHSLDLAVSKTFFKHYQINAGVQNLLDQSYRFVMDGNRDLKFTSDDLLYTNYKPGRYFTLGLRVRF
jgi:TonB-dependent receptor